MATTLIIALILAVRVLAQGVPPDPDIEAQAGAVPGAFAVRGVHGTYLDWRSNWKLPDPGNGYFTFKALAKKDIHVAISPVPGTSNPMYEIVIGAWANSLTYIRRSAQGKQLGVSDKRIAQAGVWQQYWVRLDRSRRLISVGRGSVPGSNLLLRAEDPQFVDQAAYIAFSQWESPVYYADLVLGAAPTPPPSPSSFRPRGRNGAYLDWRAAWRLHPTGDTALLFRARARSDIHVGLSPTMHVTTPMYEIVIGGWGNSRSVLRRKPQGAAVATSNARIAHPGQWDDYYIRLERSTRTVWVGRGSKVGQEVLLRYQDPAFLDGAVYFSFSEWDMPVEYSNLRLTR